MPNSEYAGQLPAMEVIAKIPAANQTMIRSGHETKPARLIEIRNIAVNALPILSFLLIFFFTDS